VTHGVLVTVAYDGAQFSGWQVQPGRRTVQAALAEAAARVARHEVVVRGASRTDAGVHAEGQVVAFDTERALTPRRWVLALNRYLPDDAAVRRAEACPPGYEPRFDAIDKTYRYLLRVGATREPLVRGRAWQLGRLARHRLPHPDTLDGARHGLDLGAMREAAAVLVGTHDFHAFRSADDTRESTVRTLRRVEWSENHAGDPNLLALHVTGDAFLKNMVRIIAGTLVDVGRGRLAPNDVRALLGPGGTRARGGVTAPPEGLTLVEVRLGRSRAPASR
jgi:tRNA pseudouridine38-40 synthase